MRGPGIKGRSLKLPTSFDHTQVHVGTLDVHTLSMYHFPACLDSSVNHLHYQSFPACLYSSVNHLHYESFPACLYSSVNHLHYQSFPACLYSSVNHLNYQSFPACLDSSVNHPPPMPKHHFPACLYSSVNHLHYRAFCLYSSVNYLHYQSIRFVFLSKLPPLPTFCLYSSVNHLHYQSITSLPEFQNKSFEELRHQSQGGPTPSPTHRGWSLGRQRMSILEKFLTCREIRPVIIKLVSTLHLLPLSVMSLDVVATWYLYHIVPNFQGT